MMEVITFDPSVNIIAWAGWRRGFINSGFSCLLTDFESLSRHEIFSVLLQYFIWDILFLAGPYTVHTAQHYSVNVHENSL